MIGREIEKIINIIGIFKIIGRGNIIILRIEFNVEVNYLLKLFDTWLVQMMTIFL